MLILPKVLVPPPKTHSPAFSIENLVKFILPGIEYGRITTLGRIEPVLLKLKSDTDKDWKLNSTVPFVCGLGFVKSISRFPILLLPLNP